MNFDMKKVLVVVCIIVVFSVIGLFIRNMRNEPGGNTVVMAPAPTDTPKQKQTYTLAEVEPHDNRFDCWLVIEGKVYDMTDFIPLHPGGSQLIKGCGKDATALFRGEPEHAEENAESTLPQYYIGELR